MSPVCRALAVCLGCFAAPACFSPTDFLPVCRQAPIEQGDGGTNRCQAGRMALACGTATAETASIFVADDPTLGEPTMHCRNLCEGTEYGVSCWGSEPPRGCRVLVDDPGISLHCCPCR